MVDEKARILMLYNMRLAILIVLASAVLPTVSRAQAPLYVITPENSSIKFHVESSIALDGRFDKWTGTLTFTSPDVTTGVLDLQIQAASVNTGSGMKDGKLKGEDFFNAKQNPVIRFRSTKVVQTGPVTFELPGDFTIRGVSKPETLRMTISGKERGSGTGAIEGTMAFDRKEYGMDSGIPFIRIADRVEVTVNIRGKKVGGPALVFKQ
jgi:polyisoprenoid-binding protein YceI